MSTKNQPSLGPGAVLRDNTSIIETLFPVEDPVNSE